MFGKLSCPMAEEKKKLLSKRFSIQELIEIKERFNHQNMNATILLGIMPVDKNFLKQYLSGKHFPHTSITEAVGKDYLLSKFTLRYPDITEFEIIVFDKDEFFKKMGLQHYGVTLQEYIKRNNITFLMEG